jgi:anti-sigma-K factor RskA
VNVKEYISSGVIESYVLGLATQAEQEEFELMCQQYPDVVEARNAFELALEKELLKDAPAAPAFIKQRIDEAIANAGALNNENAEVSDTPVRRMNVWKWVAAASLIITAGSLYWAFTADKQFKEVEQANAGLRQELDQSKEQLVQIRSDMDKLYDPGMKMVALKGTQVAPQAYTTIYWDTTGATKDVYLLINNLPQPPSEKQYQLWALLDGKPIDLGVFDYDVRQKRLLIKTKNIQNAQAFAITLEPKGGSVNPTMEQMYVMGQL